MAQTETAGGVKVTGDVTKLYHQGFLKTGGKCIIETEPKFGTTTHRQTSCVNFRVKSEGERGQSIIMNIAAFGKLADQAGDEGWAKGDTIFLDAHLKLKPWTSKDGEGNDVKKSAIQLEIISWVRQPNK